MTERYLATVREVKSAKTNKPTVVTKYKKEYITK